MPEPTVLPSMLQIAVKRGYLDLEVAGRLAAESRRTRRPVERLLVERGVLSPRRLERLNLHVRYRSLRSADKAYARSALRASLVRPDDLDAALSRQRALFESDREIVRVGAILVDEGLLTPAQDRALRQQISTPGTAPSGVGSGASAVAPSPGSAGEGWGEGSIRADEDSGSAATLLEASSSRTPLPGASSYRQIDAAIERVEALRKEQEELSTSEDARNAGPDSAAEFENACRMLARRRFEPAAPRARVDASRSLAALDRSDREPAKKSKASRPAVSTGRRVASRLGA